MRTELSNDVVKIRPYEAADAPLLFVAARESVKEMSDWLLWCHANYTIEESQSFISSCEADWDKKTRFAFAVFDALSGLFLGGIGLSRSKPHQHYANLGYWVRSSQTGRGIATSAALLAAQFGFEDLGLKRIEILAAVGNLASRRVAEKAGAEREGVLRNRIILNQSLHDAVMYSLISDTRFSDNYYMQPEK